MKNWKTTTVLAGVLALATVACENEGPRGTSGEGGSTHNSGRNCIECHGNLRYAGTIYTDASATSVLAGAKVTVTQTDGSTYTMTSDQTGNFYTSSGNPANGYTVSVEGNTVQMAQNATNGGCSSGGCHDGSATPRVYKN